MKIRLDRYKDLKTIFARASYKNWVIGLILMLCVSAVGRTIWLYPGTVWVLVAFHFSFLALVTSAWPRPRTDAYFFLAGFLFLGFWAKFTIHLIFPYPFLEPIGAFDASADQWDLALSAATAAVFGVVLFRTVYLLSARRRLRYPLQETAENIAPPDWYLSHPGKVWGGTIALALILYTANYFFAFFQTGVNPLLVLPFGINAVLAWSSFCGAALAFALLAGWEMTRRPEYFAPLVWSVCLFGIVASVSLASRAISIFLFAAYATALGMHLPLVGKKLLASWRWRLPLIMMASLIIGLILVSSFRLNRYLVPDNNIASTKPKQQEKILHPTAPLPSIPRNSAPVAPVETLTPSTRPIGMSRSDATPSEMFKQVMQLSVDRWIGLEGMLAVTGSSERGAVLLTAGLRESPLKGVDSIYQKISSSKYSFQPGFTYLTLPGAPAILFYSGSLILVLVGMFFFAGILTFIENFGVRMTGSRFVGSVLGIFMANSVCQMNFPYLWMVFVVETVIALGVIGVLRNWSGHTKFLFGQKGN